MSDPRPATQLPAARYVGFWLRLAAFLLDSLLLTLVSVPFAVVWTDRLLQAITRTAGPLPDPSDQTALLNYAERLLDTASGPLTFSSADLFNILFTTVLLPLMVIVLCWRLRGATPGKMAVGAVIVDADSGGTASTAQLSWRCLAYLVSVLPCGLGFLWIASDPRKQAWHDKLAGTIVIKRSR